MPLTLIRQDITNIVCDAIVNPTNGDLIPGGGIDALIHEKAGDELAEACRSLAPIGVGSADITPAFDLPSKYVIHTAGPVWEGGGRGEEDKLRACYSKSLALAEEAGCESVAFPLISSGAYGYPKDRVLKVALDVISTYLLTNEMTVYLVVFDKDSYEISEKLFSDVTAYIDDRYVGEMQYSRPQLFGCSANLAPQAEFKPSAPRKRRKPGKKADLACEETAVFDACLAEEANDSLEDMIRNMDEGFSLKLLRLIDAKEMDEVECYKRANVSKQTWFKIMNDAAYRPSKNTVISFAIALRLTLDETKMLLATVGYALSRSSKFDIIIEYFISHGIYDVFEIDETLFKFDQVTLGSYA